MILRFLKNILFRAFYLFGSAKHPYSPIITIKPKNDDFLRPTEGNSWNPLLGYPRNEPCYCRSGLKFKKCCLKHQGLAVNSVFAKQAAPIVKSLK